MATSDGRNINPVLRGVEKLSLKTSQKLQERIAGELDSDIEDAVDSQEIYDMIRHITDPEHPNTLEELAVLNLEDVKVSLDTSEVEVFFTPTIPNCGMATLIGLMIRVKLLRSLHLRFKVDIYIKAGKHEQEAEINK